MGRITLNEKKASKLEPVELVPQGQSLKIVADRSNSGNVYLGSSKRHCQNRGQYMVLEPGGWVTLNISSSGQVFARGSKGKQVISFWVV
jgi:hypothetical protein